MRVCTMLMALGIQALLGTVVAQVQTTTGINGTVRDGSGAAVPGVTVTVREQETGAVREAVTSETGYYTVVSLRPGIYTISASLPGFKTAVVTDREVLVAIPARVNLTLEIGEVSEEITVSASGEELINKTTAEISATISQDLVENLPNQTRNYFDLLALAPNTSPQYLKIGNLSFGQHSMRRVNAANSYESSGVFAAGANDNASNVSVDGANAQLAIYNQAVSIQSSSTIKELRLQTASANAEFGYGASAVNVITKSGTNEYHGEVFWQHRNDNLDANDFFTNLASRELPEYKRNKFGATLGGPVIRDRLHFFGNFEGSRLRQSVQGAATVPTAEMRAGDLSSYRPLQPGGGLGPTPTIYNPYDFDPETGLRRPFAGNKIPSNLLDPAMQTFLQYTALPNTVIDEIPRFSGLRPSLIDENQYGGRIDWTPSENTTIYGRYTFAEREAIRGGLLALEGESTPSSIHSSVLNWTQLLSPTLVNDFSISYSRPKWGIGRLTAGVGDISAEMGLRAVSDRSGSPRAGVPDFSLAQSSNYLWDPTQNTYQLKDDFSITKGMHVMKFGAHITERRMFFIKEAADKGNWNFDRIFTQACPLGNQVCDQARQAAGLEEGGLGFADLLLGAPYRDFLQIRPVTWHGHQRYYGLYLQDTWQLSSRMTLSAGLRYEHWRPWLLPRNNAAGFDFSGDGHVLYSLQNPLDAFDPATDYGRDAALNPAVPREAYRTSNLDFAPRIGIAYTLGADTVLRVAGGIFKAGNLNTNQLVETQAGAPPATLEVRREIARNEQLPPILVREEFPLPVAQTIPQAFDDPIVSLRIMGQPEYPIPTVYQWSLSLQHRFSPNWSASFDYLGSHTIHNQQFVNMNAGALPVGELADVPLQQRRRLPGWGIIGGWVPWGWQKFQSGTIGVKNREWRGLTTMANFIWAKNLSSSRSVIGSDQGNTHYQYYDLWRGRANYTPTGRFVSAWSYRLPIGQGRTFALNGVADHVLGGWTISGITEFSTGAPETVTAFGNSGTGEGNQLPDRIAGCDLNAAPRDRFDWFNRSCFVAPAFGTWGNASQGLIDNPGINNWNISLGKSFRVHETHRLELRVESFNTFNHTQWGNVVTNMNSSSYGRISGTRPARQVQIALFYQF